MTITRPLLRWLGGKYRLAPWIISQFPPHDIYVEPFGGAASVLLQKPQVRGVRETYNDLDLELVNLFQVLRSSRADELIRSIAMTPYSRTELRACATAVDGALDPVEQARRTIVRSHLAHGNSSSRIDRTIGFRVDGMLGETDVAGNWSQFPSALEQIVQRFRSVTIECRPAIELMRGFRSDRALIYLDPPYTPETRSVKNNVNGERYHSYAVEMTIDDHVELLDECLQSDAMILISGYPSTLYGDALLGWTQQTMAARAHRNSPRTEVLWMNPAAAARRRDCQPMLEGLVA